MVSDFLDRLADQLREKEKVLVGELSRIRKVLEAAGREVVSGSPHSGGNEGDDTSASSTTATTTTPKRRSRRSKGSVTKSGKPRKKRRPLTEAEKKAISERMKKSWAKRKAVAKKKGK